MRIRSEILFHFGLALGAGLVLAPAAHAQVLYGSIIGTVEDQSGGLVPNAGVTIVNNATGVSREVTADDAGRYTIANVLPGVYDVKINATGFRPVTRSGVEVTINNVTRVDARLEVGGVTEQVTISTGGVTLQTDKSDVRSEIGSGTVANLPLPAYRNYQGLLNLVPGTTPAEFQNAVVDSPARALTTSVNGTNRNNNNTRVDGATNVFLWLPHHTVYVAPVESIETVSVSTTSFDAEQGMAGGAAITVATKSGTNDLHGVLFGYWDNQDLRARNFFLRTTKPASSDKIGGGTLGGRILRNKLFYFGSYEGFFERSGQSLTNSVPTATLRSGDFSATGTTIFDPSTGTAAGTGRVPFANNVIPMTSQSAISRRIQDLVPLPNIAGRGDVENYAVAGTEKLDRHNYDLKVNYLPVQAVAVWGKYSRMDALVNSPFSLGAAGGPGLSRAGVGNGDTTVNIATFGHTWTISPVMVMDGVFGYTRFDQSVTGPDHGTYFGSDVWRIPGTNNPIGSGADRIIGNCPTSDCYSGMPFIDHDLFTDWGNIYGWEPLFRNDRSFTYSTNVSRAMRAHELRWGFDMVRHHMDHWQPEISNGPRGYFQFRGGPSALSGSASPNNFNSYAAFLLGQPVQMQKAVQNFLMTNREWQFGWYVRDRWQASRKLTINIGLRYEYYPLITRKDRGIERWDPATNQVFMGGIGNVPRSVGITTSKRLFGPRVGFAYRVDDVTVIRSGYGITFDPLPFARPLRGLYPSTIAATFNQPNSFASAGTLETGIPEIPVPDTTSGIVTLPPTVDMGPRSPWAGELHRGYIQSWNFTIERRLPGDMVTSIAYVGNQTVHHLADLDINVAAPGAGNAGRPLAATQGRRITANMWDGWLSANYHSMQVALNRQFAKGLLLKGAYTWSKAISMTDEDGWASVNRNWSPQIRWNRATAGYDRTHTFTMGWMYEFPFGPGKAFAQKGAVSWLARGWQTNGTFSAYTGRPFTVTADGSSVNAPGNTQSADQVKAGTVRKIGEIGPGQSFYDPLAFAAVTGVRFGSTGRNTLRGPGLVNADLSLFRSFAITERHKVEFKAEAYNFTNTPKFENPGTNVSNLQVNPDGSIRNLGNFLAVTSTRAASLSLDRQFRFGLRYSF